MPSSPRFGHDDLLAGLREHPDGDRGRVAAPLMDGRHHGLEHLVDRLGGRDRPCHLGGQREALGALLGLVAQAHPAQGGGDLLRHGLHQRCVGGVKPVGTVVVQRQRRGGRAVEHRCHERRLVRERSDRVAGLGEPADDDLLARGEGPARGAVVDRPPAALDRRAHADAIGDHEVLLRVGQRQDGRHGAVVGRLEDRLHGGPEHRPSGVGRGDDGRDGCGECKPLRAPLRLVAQAHAAQGRGELLGDRGHQRLVGVVELVHRPARDLEHRNAAAVEHHRCREQ